MRHGLLLLSILLAGIASDAAGQPSPDEPTEAEIERLVRDLSAEEFGARDTATRRLREIGQLAIPALRRLREEASTEGRSRIDRLIERIGWIDPDDEERIRKSIGLLRTGAPTERSAAIRILTRHLERSSAARRLAATELLRPLEALEITIVDGRHTWVHVRNRTKETVLIPASLLRALGHESDAPEVSWRGLSDAALAAPIVGDEPSAPVDASTYFEQVNRLAAGGRLRLNLGELKTAAPGVWTFRWRLPAPTTVRFGETDLPVGFRVDERQRVLRHRRVVYPKAVLERLGVILSAKASAETVEPAGRASITVTLENRSDAPVALGPPLGRRLWLALLDDRRTTVGGAEVWSAKGDLTVKVLGAGAKISVTFVVPVSKTATGELLIRAGLAANRKRAEAVFGDSLGPAEVRIAVAAK